MFQSTMMEFADFFTLYSVLFIFIGIFIGIIFGCIPGLTGNLAIVLSIPMTFKMDPINALTFLLGIYVGGKFGGSISAILIGTPGTNSAACTLIDGYPLAQQGHAKKALDMSLTASTIGGMISAIALLLFAPMIAKVAITFGPPEYFTLAIFGVSIIAGVSGQSVKKGIIVAGLGFLLSSIGLDPMTGSSRLTFGNVNLLGGLPLMPVMLGVFTINNVLSKINTQSYKEDGKSKLVEVAKDDKLTKEDMKKSWLTIIKSSIIGIIVGATPGAGGSIASFMSYGEAKRSSKHPEKFGNGAIEGVAASEAGNSSVTGAVLIPMLTLGIPGGAAAATLMGALMMHGLPPGPMLFHDHGPVIYAIIATMFIISIFLFIQGKLLFKAFAKIALVPQVVLLPLISMFCIAGAFAFSNSIFNVYIVITMGVVAYFIRKVGFPPVPIIIGFLLGNIAETNLRRSLVMSQGSWSIFVTRPICIVFLVLAVLSIIFLTRANAKAKKNTKEMAEETKKNNA